MYKKTLLFLLLTSLLTACISVSVDSATPTESHADFVTATLPPTKPGFVPVTLTPIPANTVAPTLAITAPPNCKDSTVLLRDVTIQDNTVVKAREKFTKTWEFQNAGYVSELISLINQARASANLPTLTINSQLTAAAQGHSADMACNNFLGHTGSDGSYLTDRIRRTGYPGGSEIIAIGTPQNAMDQWRADPGHWDFVLNPYISEIGVGYAYYSSSDFGGYITVDFGGQ